MDIADNYIDRLTCNQVYPDMKNSDLKHSSTEPQIGLSQAEFTAILEATGEGILVVDNDGRVVLTNARFAEMWHIPDELIAAGDDERLLGFVLDQLADPDAFVAKVQQLYLTDDEDFDNITFKDGRVFERISRPLLCNNKLTGRVWSFRDITSRKLAESALKEKEERYSNLFHQSNDAIVVHDDQGRIVDLNRQALHMFGYTRSELLNKRVHDLKPPELLKDCARAFDTIFEKGTVNFDTTFTRKNGDNFSAEVTSSMFKAGSKILIQGIVRDITERQRMSNVQSSLFRISEAANVSDSLEDLLRAVHKILGGLIDTTNFYVALYDSKTGSYSFPYCIDEVDGDASGIIIDDMRFSLTDYIRRMGKPELIDVARHMELCELGEVRIVGSPSEIWLGVPLRATKGVIGVVAVQSYHNRYLYSEADMEILSFVSEQLAMAIERKQSEDQLGIEKAHLEQLFNSSPEAIALIKNNGQIMRINSEFTNLFGYTEDEAVGKIIDDILIPDGHDNETTQLTSKVSQGEKIYTETQRRHKDGALVDVSLLATPITVDGGSIAIYAIYRDISSRRKTEEKQRQLQEKLNRAEKMESLGVLAGGVAHDLNNMLGPLVGYPELILRKLPEDSPLRKQVQRMGNAAADAAEIIQDLLTLARRGRYEMSLIDLNEVIHNFLDSPTFNKLIEEKSRIDVEIELDESIRKMNGSSHQLSKVIMNLIVNAFDAISEQGRLVIRTREEYVEKLHCGHDKVKPGHYIVLSIEDSGMGIPAEDISKIFEPYYSKKKMGRSGSGLGLSVVYGIVKDHKGYYDVTSTVGEGTQFILYFPVDLSGRETERIDKIALEGAESILVVDDVEEQREMAAELLQSLGYQVTTVPGGQQAVEYLTENKADLVVLDMIMEEDWDGLTTYQKIQRLHPHQKAIIVSGFSPTDRVRSMQTLGAGSFVRKPYTLEAIGRAVRLELDRTGKTASV